MWARPRWRQAGYVARVGAARSGKEGARRLEASLDAAASLFGDIAEASPE